MSIKLTRETILDYMKELAQEAKEHPRDFYMMTGREGHKRFEEATQRQVRIDFALRRLVTARSIGGLTKEEVDTIRSMIHSPDQENLVVAEYILEEKTKR